VRFRVSIVCWLCWLAAPVSILSQAISIRLNYLATWTGADSLGEFRDPSGLVVDPSGCVYLADTGNERVIKLDPLGKTLNWIGGYGWNEGQFNRPVAVAASNGLDVFVADFMNRRVQRFDKDLHYLSTLEPEDDWPADLRFEFPGDVRLSDQGELFCLDTQNRRVIKFDVLGRPQTAFGGYDAGEGRLVRPERICLSGDRIFVSDPKRIAVFDMHGNHLTDWGSGILSEPVGMAAIGKMLCVADCANRTIFFFEDGVLVNTVWALPAEFKEPVDVGASGNRLYVLDRVRGIRIIQWAREPADR
jgi:hypothetical protein